MSRNTTVGSNFKCPNVYSAVDDLDETVNDKEVTFSGDGIALKQQILTLPLIETDINAVGILSVATGNTMSFLRLTALKTALDAVEIPPSATDFQVNDTILVTDGVDTTTVNSTSVTTGTLNYTTLNPAILPLPPTPVASFFNSVVAGGTTTNIWYPISRGALIREMCPSVGITIDATTRDVTVPEDGNYYVSSQVTFASLAMLTNQYVGLRIVRDRGGLLLVIISKLQLLPLSNDGLEQSIGGVLALLAGDIISVQYNANTSAVGGAGTVSIATGSAINIYKI
tara:strand:- start:84 stop:935 length:852 start_codon:yes stop_codon:yes gene_type:complete